MTVVKNYTYTVDGHVNKDGEPKSYTIPSFNRNLECDFDLESIAHQAALRFFLDNEEYQTEDKYPLTFRFTGNGITRDAEMYLQFAPTFQTKEGKIRREESIEVKKTRTRKIKGIPIETTDTK